MPRTKKKFIDKKHAVTFHLVHRSQQDPMLVSEDSQHVLLPAAKKPKEKQLEEQREFGIYFDDDYNYLQHLRETEEACVLEEVETFRIDSTEKPKPIPDQKLILPSTVFASNVETNVGLLNKAAPNTGPKIGWDPEIVATLDGDFDYEDPEGNLEDDFFVHANAAVEGEESEEEDDSDSDSCSDVSSNAAGRSDEESEKSFMEEETKSHFTNYSMTSSVVPRSETLMDLDDQFEKFFEQYDESEIGALDFDNIDGNVDENCERMSKLLQAYQDNKEGQRYEALKAEPINSADLDDLSSSSGEEVEVDEETGEKWDCESILSTYSNLYNRPKLIEEPKKEKKIKLNSMGIPSESFSRPGGLVKKDLEAAMNSSVISEVSCRDKNESKEEKKNRKLLVKEQKRERRIEKKFNKEAFKEAHIKEQRESANIHKNMRSMVIA